MSGSGPAPFGVSVNRTGSRAIVGARGELDLATAPELEDALLPLLREGVDTALDLRALEFMDSTGVRVVVAAHLAAEEHGARFTVVLVADGPVARLLEISGLDAILDVATDL